MTYKQQLFYIVTLYFVCFAALDLVWADANQYEGNIFEGTNLNSHWVIFSKPPFVYEGNKVISVKATTSREVLLSMVPKELTVNEKNEVIFFVGNLSIAGENPYSYKEAGFVIPVIYKKGTEEEMKGEFIPILYLDKTAPIVGGREAYGYNKFHAEIELMEEKNQVRGTVTQFGKTLIDITVHKDNPKVSGPIKIDTGGHFVIKRIPSAAYDGTLDIHQLNYIEVLDYEVADYIAGKGELTLGGPDWEQLNKIPVNSIIESYYSTTGSTLSKGTTLHDYLSQ